MIYLYLKPNSQIIKKIGSSNLLPIPIKNSEKV